MTIWLGVLAIVGGALGVFLGLRALFDILSPLPDPPCQPRARVIDLRNRRDP